LHFPAGNSRLLDVPAAFCLSFFHYSPLNRLHPKGAAISRPIALQPLLAQIEKMNLLCFLQKQTMFFLQRFPSAGKKIRMRNYFSLPTRLRRNRSGACH
jgi:hypothetical protein